MIRMISAFCVLCAFPLMAQTSLEFDGTNDYVNCGSDPSLDITGTAITMEAWVYPTSFQPNIWQGNVINKNDISQSGYMLRVGGTGQVNFNYGSFGAWNELNTGINVLSLNTWQHIAGTYDGITARIYVNGVEVAAIGHTTSIASANNPLLIGEDPEWTGRYFPGRIDEVRVWNVTRSASEIMAAMNDEMCTTDPNLVAYYRFNDGVAGGNNAGQITLTDESGNGNNGTITGATWEKELGNFFEFNGSSDKVEGSISGIGSQFTVELWVSPNDFTGNENLFELYDSATAASNNRIFFSGGSLLASKNGGGGRVYIRASLDHFHRADHSTPQDAMAGTYIYV